MPPQTRLAFSPRRRTWLMRSDGGAELRLSPEEALDAAAEAGRSHTEILAKVLRATADCAASSSEAGMAAELVAVERELLAADAPDDLSRLADRLHGAQLRLARADDPLAFEVGDAARGIERLRALEVHSPRS